MITAVISVYKVANFPDGGGHFWVYMQYAQGLRRLGCEVYWLEQFRPPGDPALEAQLLSSFFERRIWNVRFASLAEPDPRPFANKHRMCRAHDLDRCCPDVELLAE